jgi:hypothetical protein
VILFLAICGGWFLLAYRELGHALIQKMFVRELYQHAVNRGDGRVMGRGFYEPTLYFLTRFAPWSVFCCLAFWRICRRPSADQGERRLERFLFCWFAIGIVIFSLAAHQRADLIFPLIPAAALLGGREIARLLTAKPDRQYFALAGGVAALALILTSIEYLERRKRNESVVQTLALGKLADSIRAQGGERFPLIHVDSSPVLQMNLDTFSPNVTLERAIKLLNGPAAAFVAVKNVDAGLPRIDTNSVRLLLEAPRTGKTRAAVLGNRPTLGWTGPLATLVGPLAFEMNGIRKFYRKASEFWFEAEPGESSVALTNESGTPKSARLHFIRRESISTEDISLSPGETRRIRVGA